MITNNMRVVQLKMIEARFWPKMKFETIFFQVLWQFFNPKGSLPQAGGRGAWGEFRPPYKFWAKSVRIFSNAHRQVLHSAKLKEVASAQSAPAWYFSTFLKAFLKSHESVRSAIREFEHPLNSIQKM